MPVEEARKQREAKIADARRRRWVRVLVGVVIAACLTAAGYIIYNSSLFVVRRIEVAGNDELTQSEVIEASNLSLGENIFKVDLDAARTRLAKNAWFRSVSVTRKLPAILHINIRERVAVAGLFTQQATYLIDSTGFVLAKRDPLADTGLPTIRDIEVRRKIEVGRKVESKVLADALRSLTSLSWKLRKTVDTVSAPAADKLVFYTSEGLEIDYGGAEDMQAKNEVINRVLKEESGKVVTIDVRVVTNPTSKPRIQRLGGAPAN